MGRRWRQWSHDLSLDLAQRRVLILLTALVLLYAAVRLWREPAYVDDPQPVRGDRADELADRLDPNTATWEELAALPGIGEKRARAIIARRDFLKARKPDSPAFQAIGDLRYVPGFGPAMTEQIRPYLVFPTTQPTAKIEADNSRTAE